MTASHIARSLSTPAAVPALVEKEENPTLTMSENVRLFQLILQELHAQLSVMPNLEGGGDLVDSIERLQRDPIVAAILSDLKVGS